MIVVVAILVGFATVPLFGGKLRRLAQLDLRHLWIVWVAFVIQTLLFEVFATRIPGTWSEAIHLGTYVAGFVFVWLNRHIRGALLIGLGAGMNALAISANGGVMPANPDAWRRAGLPDLSQMAFENSNTTTDAHLAVLGDIFFVPAGWPFANVFSIGDVVIVLAGTYMAHRWCRQSMTSNAWPAPQGSPVSASTPRRSADAHRVPTPIS